MNRILIISAFVFLMLLAAGANAQCLTCITSDPWATGPGYCGWAAGSFCSRTCCAAGWGDSCRLPDFFDPCYGSRPGTFQVALFKDRLPQPQIVPGCHFIGLMRRSEPAIARRSTT